METSEIIGCEQAETALAAIDAALDRLADVGFDGLKARGNVEVLRRLESVTRRVDAIGNHAIRAVDEASFEERGRSYPRPLLADALRITPADAGQRITVANELTERISMTGELLEPELPATAAQVERGTIGRDHVQVIRRFFKQLPSDVSFDDACEAEHSLATFATEMRPDELKKVAIHLAAHLNPDGNFDDKFRKRMRGVTIGAQRQDLLSKISGYITPELRGMLERVFAKLGRPGVANPDDERPVVDGEPSPDAAHRDLRSPCQRQHDALLAMSRELLASGTLGQHHGLPTTMVINTTLDQLTDAANGIPTRPAMTGGGTYLPMRDVIKLASNSHHYLAVFDGHSNRPLYLGRAKRLASADQRIMLHATDRGCTFPGCDKPGYWAESHHIIDHAKGGGTDITNLTFACERHHQLAGDGWRTKQTPMHRTAWIPPKSIDPQQKPRINRVHHPEERINAVGDDEP